MNFSLNEMRTRFATLFSLKSQKVERADGGLGVWGKDSVRPHYLFWSCDGMWFFGGGWDVAQFHHLSHGQFSTSHGSCSKRTTSASD